SHIYANGHRAHRRRRQTAAFRLCDCRRHGERPAPARDQRLLQHQGRRLHRQLRPVSAFPRWRPRLVHPLLPQRLQLERFRLHIHLPRLGRPRGPRLLLRSLNRESRAHVELTRPRTGASDILHLQPWVANFRWLRPLSGISAFHPEGRTGEIGVPPGQPLHDQV
ncbi:Os04g0433100, partial [Oryza sativa Japonica Group]